LIFGNKHFITEMSGGFDKKTLARMLVIYVIFEKWVEKSKTHTVKKVFRVYF